MKRRANNLLDPQIGFFAVLVLVAGCGGGGGGTPPPPPPSPTITSVTVTCVPTTVLVSQTSQCSAAVQGTGSFSSAVTWSASVGTINASGLFTAPASAGTATITAKSVQDPTKSGTANVTVNLPPPTITSVTVTCVPTTVLVNQTSQCSAAVQGTGGFSSAVTWSSSVGTVSVSGLFTAPASAGTATITAKSVQDPTKSGTANITVNLPPPLTVSLSETAATVVLGGSHSFTATPSDPAATISWSLSGPGSLSVMSGSVSVYSVPTSVPTSFSATITVTATLGAQTATATTQITLNYPSVVLNGATPRNIFLAREDFAGVTFSGSGIYPGCTNQFNATGAANPITPNASFTQFTTLFIFDSNHFDPRAHTVVVDCTANGNGAGMSNVFGFSFIGNQNTVALSATEIFFLDQGTGFVFVYDLAGNSKRNFNVGRLEDAIAYDNNRLIMSRSNAVAVTDLNGNGIGGVVSSLPLAVSAKNDIACATQDQANRLICFDASVFNPTPQSISIGATPMEVAMTTTASGQLSAVVLNAGDGTLAVAPVPLPAQGTAIPSVRLPGMTIGHGEQTGTSGGMQLKMLEYTNNQSVPVRVAAVTSRFDKLIWFVDVSNPASMPIVGPFPLSGDPYRLAVDTANKVFVVALADYNAADGSAVTRFVRVNPSNGVQTNLNSTVPFIASGLAVNPVSGQIIACGGATCIQVPNN